MKNLFDINMTKGCEVPFHPAFKALTVREADEALGLAQDRSDDEMETVAKKYKLPFWLELVSYALLIVGIPMLASVFRVLTDESVEKPFASPAMFVYITVGLLTVAFAVAVNVIQKKRTKKMLESDEYKNALKHSEITEKTTLDALKVPADAAVVDVYSRPYKVSKKGKESRGVDMVEYLCQEFYAFVENDSLCLADLSVVLSIPLSSFKKIVKDDRRITFFGWNKDENYNADTYKEYKITENNAVMSIKGACSVIFEHEGEEMEILVPPYDIKKLASLLNLEITEAQN